MNQLYKKRNFKIIAFVLFLAFASCKNAKKEGVETQNEKALVVSDTLKWSERMALSEIHRVPDPTLIDFRTTPGWSYCNGLVLQAVSKVFDQTDNQKLMDYIYAYDTGIINKDGTIKTYKLSSYNLDMIKSGDIVFYMNQKNETPRYRIVMDSLHKQLQEQPTTSEGGYWHKKRYPSQMWLDGVYMAEPFHAKYASTFLSGKEAEKVIDHVVLQFDLIEKHSRDSETGLYYHGWDESKEQRWADKKTGLSKNFWSRGMGWYGMALVDVIELLPEEHPGRKRIIGYLNQYAEAIVKFQDESGAWYQVLNLPEREGNYLEATGTSMFTYTLAKGVNKGYLPENFMSYAKKSYAGLLKDFITVANDGVVSLNKCCGVAGLGGDPYRDASFDYYVNEIIRSNDPKGTGPFIMASLEMGK